MKIIFPLFCLLPSDWIAIINILVTSIIGVWIGLVVQKNLTTNRAVKDYFINEMNAINSSYMAFICKLYKCKLSARSIQEWLKVMNIRIEVAENAIKTHLKVNPQILDNHVTLKQFITSLEEFNNGYKDPFIILSTRSKQKILEQNRSLKNAFANVIVDINKANNRKSFWKKR